MNYYCVHGKSRRVNVCRSGRSEGVMCERVDMHVSRSGRSEGVMCMCEGVRVYNDSRWCSRVALPCPH